jgi:hypothetical protein
MLKPAPTRTGWAASRGPFPRPPARPRPDGIAAVYRRRDPTATPLYPLVHTEPGEPQAPDGRAARCGFALPVVMICALYRNFRPLLRHRLS